MMIFRGILSLFEIRQKFFHTNFSMPEFFCAVHTLTCTDTHTHIHAWAHVIYYIQYIFSRYLFFYDLTM